MVKTFAVIFGIVFLAVRILGFVPGITNDEMLLCISMVNVAHNVVHIASGIIFLLAAMGGAGLSKMWFQIFGITTPSSPFGDSQ